MNINKFLIFKNFPEKGYWEISDSMKTTYLKNEIILSNNVNGLNTLLNNHGVLDTKELISNLIEITINGQEDIFIINV